MMNDEGGAKPPQTHSNATSKPPSSSSKAVCGLEEWVSRGPGIWDG